MISIVVHYSCDRLSQLLNTISCIDDMKGTADAEKLILVDGKTNVVPVGWEVVEIERDDSEFYNCSKIWNKGFQLAKNDIVLTMESDRILPKNWLNDAMWLLDDISFVSAATLYSLDQFYDLVTLKSIRDNTIEHTDKLVSDHRIFDPNEGIGRKNPMSGCLLTTKKAFAAIGGFDEGYLQAGYHDLDAFRKAYLFNPTSIRPAKGIELHQKHDYDGGMERFKIVNLWNAVKYHDKWGLELHPNIVNLSEQVGISIDSVRTNKLIDLLDQPSP